MQKGNEGNADLWEEFETVLKRTNFKTSFLGLGQRTCDKSPHWSADHNLSGQRSTGIGCSSFSRCLTVIDRCCEGQAPYCLDTHSFAAELLFRRRVALLALRETEHDLLTVCAVVRCIPPTQIQLILSSFVMIQFSGRTSIRPILSSNVNTYMTKAWQWSYAFFRSFCWRNREIYRVGVSFLASFSDKLSNRSRSISTCSLILMLWLRCEITFLEKWFSLSETSKISN